MMSLAHQIPKKKIFSYLSPVIPLEPEEKPKVDEEKGKYISFELKNRADSRAGSMVYKKFVRKFEEGTPQEWIELMLDLNEIWTQNSITGGPDIAATIRALVRGETLVSFETALEDAILDENGNKKAITPEFVTEALEGVTASVFPHRALDIQKNWMQRGIKKPYSMSIRKLAVALYRFNQYLIYFPGAKKEDMHYAKASGERIFEIGNYDLKIKLEMVK